jgi:hypothetical protein
MKLALCLALSSFAFGVACGGESEDIQAAQRLVRQFHESTVNRDTNVIRDMLHAEGKTACSTDVLAEILPALDSTLLLSIEETRETAPEVIEVVATGPWGRGETFVVHLGPQPYIEPPETLTQTCKDEGVQISMEEYSNAVVTKDASSLLRLYDDLQPFTCAADTMEEALAELPLHRELSVESVEYDEQNEDSDRETVAVVASGPWGDSWTFVLTLGDHRLFAPLDTLSLRCNEIELERVQKDILALCLDTVMDEGLSSLDSETRSRCLEFAEIQQLYTGPYSFVGNNKTITNEFCVTADKVTLEYAASGIGRFPDIYHLTVGLYIGHDDYVDSVVGLEGSGALNLRTNGPGCYYLEVDPFDAAWTLTVSQ